MLILKCWWRWSLRSGWCVECDGLMGSLRSESWWVLMMSLIGKLCDPWGKLMISLMIFCWWVPKYHCRMRRSGVGFFQAFQREVDGVVSVLLRGICVCVLFVWFGFFGVAFMSYLDSGLLFDNNLGKTQLDKIGVILSTTWICFWLGLFFWLSYCSMYYSRIYLSKHHGQMKGSLRVV